MRNIAGEVENLERENANGDNGNLPKNFQKGDFVKLFGQRRLSTDNLGKERISLRVLSSKLLKTKEQIKAIEEKKDSILGAIKKFQSEDKSKNVEKKQNPLEQERGPAEYRGKRLFQS